MKHPTLRPIAILGAGNMASSLALHLARHERQIKLWSIEPDVTDDLNHKRCNTKYLPGHVFPAHVCATGEIREALEHADIVFVAVPSFALRETLMLAKPFLSKDAIIVSLTKGLDAKTLRPVILEAATSLPTNLRPRVCTIGGPAIANELAKGCPTAIVVAGKHAASVRRVQTLLQDETVKVSASRDLLGVGLASSLKNPYAIALGLCDGLRYPTNAKAMIFTLALQEMAQIMQRAGAQRETILGLAGVGDLIVTGFSPHGRNRTYGERLATADSKDPTKLGLTTVEGLNSLKQTVALCQQLRLKLPLLSTIDRCLKQSKNFSQPFIKFIASLHLN